MTPPVTHDGAPPSPIAPEPSREPPTTKGGLEDETVRTGADDPVDLMGLSDRDMHLWADGYQWGYVHGLERGGDQRDAEWQAIHDRAVKIVRVMATLPAQPKIGEPKW